MLNVLEQKKHRDLEYVVIDGGSADGSIDIIRRHADRLRYWVSEPDAGIYHAMNKGWEAADDDSFVLFLGAGDRIVSLPGDEEFKNADVIYGKVLMGEEAVFTPRCDLHLKLYNTMHHQALLVQKALHPAPPFDVAFPVYADFDVNQRLWKGGARFLYSSGFLCYARPGGVSDRQPYGESLRVIAKNFGPLWVVVALSAYLCSRIFPFLKNMRPVSYRKSDDR